MNTSFSVLCGYGSPGGATGVVDCVCLSWSPSNGKDVECDKQNGQAYAENSNHSCPQATHALKGDCLSTSFRWLLSAGLPMGSKLCTELAVRAVKVSLAASPCILKFIYHSVSYELIMSKVMEGVHLRVIIEMMSASHCILSTARTDRPRKLLLAVGNIPLVLAIFKGRKLA
jgi:hypothetical protein